MYGMASSRPSGVFRYPAVAGIIENGGPAAGEARQLIERLQPTLPTLLANLVSIFDPDCVVVGGGLVDSWAVLREAVTTAFAEQVDEPKQLDLWRDVAAA